MTDLAPLAADPDETDMEHREIVRRIDRGAMTAKQALARLRNHGWIAIAREVEIDYLRAELRHRCRSNGQISATLGAERNALEAVRYERWALRDTLAVVVEDNKRLIRELEGLRKPAPTLVNASALRWKLSRLLQRQLAPSIGRARTTRLTGLIYRLLDETSASRDNREHVTLAAHQLAHRWADIRDETGTMSIADAERLVRGVLDDCGYLSQCAEAT